MDAEEEATVVQGHRTWTGMPAEGEAAVGRIAIWAARVEENIVRLCAQLINADNFHIGYTVTANMSASAMADLAKKLVTTSKLFSDEDKSYVTATLVEAKEALMQRNQILHASVGEIMFDDKSVFYRRKKGSVPNGPSSARESTLHGLEELDAIGVRLFNVSEGLGAYVNLP
ncbi:hypothetical protein ACX80L_05320 [Arthrobacter sp. MDT1-48-3]